MSARFDLCVIGAGAGGLSVASGAAQLGAKVALIEGGAMGGDCLNHGCVPSKALLAAAKAAQAQRQPGPFGIAPVAPRVDFAAVRAHIAGVIAGIAPHDSQERFEGLGVTVIRGWARFTGPAQITVNDQQITARRFVIATGSRPDVPPIPGLDQVPYLTNETLFDLETLPEHLLVIGGGPIGCEMALAFARLGAKVSLIEARSILGRDDPELVTLARESLRSAGVRLLEGARIMRLTREEAEILLRTDTETLRGSHLLLATGRTPALGPLNLDAAGIAHDVHGLRLDKGLRTSNRRVYAIGDAAGGMQFTHVAGYHAGLVVRSALLGLPVRARTDHIPRVTYLDPEIAQVGLTETEARAAHGARLEVIRQALGANDRARCDGAPPGMMKLMVVRGRPVGVSLIAPHAGELIQLWAFALANRTRLSAIAGMVAPYPSLGEISKAATGTWFAPRLFGNRWLKRLVALVQQI